MPENLSAILTSIGLEVESLEKYEEFKGGLQGLVIGEVMECQKHPGADNLFLTRVNIGDHPLLQIVCGAPNVAAGQKVVVAPVGSTIYPVSGDSVTMKKVKIRGEESNGMICAEDEISLGDDHSGIIILPGDLLAGTPAADYFQPYQDHVFEIGLTPNRMDAMSHFGVAKDVMAWLRYHKNETNELKSPLNITWNPAKINASIQVIIEDRVACQRYSGVGIKGITVKQSPGWLVKRLKSIGVRPINNIVDITNFVLHETGQPLHAFDSATIKGNRVIVKTLLEGSKFVTLDGKERTLSSTDLMICNGEGEPMCIGGVFGGSTSGVTNQTKDIFLESAWFDPVSIRRSSLKHGLRTDAATRFEKGVDISQTVNVLKRAALLIKELAGGELTEDIIDVFPIQKHKTRVSMSFKYLQKISGKTYSPGMAKTILESLGFDIINSDENNIEVAVPFSKPDIHLPADLVEEIMRIDGFDNIEIPNAIRIAPSVELNGIKNNYKEKIAGMLSGSGFSEIFTNSITNSAYYENSVLEKNLVRMRNNLSSELDVLRPSMLETGLEAISYNLNRQNRDLAFFEFGKTYERGNNNFIEKEHLCLYVTGHPLQVGWRNKSSKADIFYLKGVCEVLAKGLNLPAISYETGRANQTGENTLLIHSNSLIIGEAGTSSKKISEKFSLRQPVYYVDLYLETLLDLANDKIVFSDIARYPIVHRDLSMVVAKNLSWEKIQNITKSLKLSKLKNIKLFDVFEHEKIGSENKSLAIHYTFLDNEKTLTDKEIDTMMQTIINLYEKQFGALVRKG